MTRGSEVLFSVSDRYFAAASTELRDELGDVSIERLGPDLGVVTGAAVEDVAAPFLEGRSAFVRHLGIRRTVVAADPHEVARACVDAAAGTGAVTLQVWSSGVGALKAEAVRALVEDTLTAAGIRTAREGNPLIVAACLTPSGGHICRTPLPFTLAEWPGGRVRMARRADQVSRAEFKLEELLELTALQLPSGASALDLGASPGGWTRVLRRHGLRVRAVDPADLDPLVVADPGVQHVRTTAGRYLADSDEQFDVIVNDMRMQPLASADVMRTAASHLAPGGTMVMTLKITPKRARSVVRSAVRTLSASYSVRFLRQLFHNRDEVTVLAERR